MEDALVVPRLLVAGLGGLLIVVGLIWIYRIEQAKKADPPRVVAEVPGWPEVLLYFLKHLPPEYLVPLSFIAIGAAMAVGAVWNVPAAAGAATASPTPS